MPQIKKKYEVALMSLVLVAEVGLWFLLRPETYWQRSATVFFGAVLLAFIGAMLYLYGKNIAVKPDVSEK